MRYIHRLSGLIFALAMCGCVPSKSFDRQNATDLHTITIVGPEEPTHYAAISTGKGTPFQDYPEFNAEISGSNFRLGHIVRSTVGTALRSRGYEVSEQVLSHPNGNLLDSNLIREVRSDAVLDCVIVGPGYAPNLFIGALTPTILIDVQLLSPKTGEILFGRRYIYTSETIGPRVTILPTNSRYEFSSIQALLSDPKLAAEGLGAVAPLVANDIAVALAK